SLFLGDSEWPRLDSGLPNMPRIRLNPSLFLSTLAGLHRKQACPCLAKFAPFLAYSACGRGLAKGSLLVSAHNEYLENAVVFVVPRMAPTC
ncbi:hypothetical protein Tco_0022648, partial [Tanacetum coccineum]